RLGASRSPYREQACMARILRGGGSLMSAETSTLCAGNDQADGMLVLGLYHLRRARFAGAANRPSALELAQVWFDQRLREIARSGPPPEGKFRWPGTVAAPVVKDMLQYGKAKVVSCTGLSADANLTIEQIRKAEDFYRFFGVEECGPAQ